MPRHIRLGVTALALAAAATAASAADFAGRYTGEINGKRLLVDLAPDPDGGYRGSLHPGLDRYPCQAHEQPDGSLAGTFLAGGHTFDFTATLAGDALSVSTAGRTYTASRRTEAVKLPTVPPTPAPPTPPATPPTPHVPAAPPPANPLEDATPPAPPAAQTPPANPLDDATSPNPPRAKTPPANPLDDTTPPPPATTRPAAGGLLGTLSSVAAKSAPPPRPTTAPANPLD